MKLIAEPWDLGAGGSQMGNCPVHWTECNAKYRDTMRAFWKGDYKHSGRRYAGGATSLLQGRTRALFVPTLGHRGVARGPAREEQS